MKPIDELVVAPALPAELAALEPLARNLHWTWDAATQELFRSLDPELFDAGGGNPLRLLHELEPARLEELAGDPGFRERLRAAVVRLDAHCGAPSVGGPLVAYFSPEFGVSEVLPQYSGGLGVLAGDHLKAASDLGVGLVAVGLFYRHGYFRQTLDASGLQRESYPVLHRHELPMTPVLHDGDVARIHVELPGATLHAAIWRVDVGRVPLLLLDSDLPENGAAERIVTDRLYGGNTEHRLRQEILLGVGGVRALRACGYAPDVFHSNEGHAGFLGLERVRELVLDRGLDVDTAVEAVRAGTVFTTHTPVPAGIDRFPRELVGRYFGAGGVPTGMPVDRVLALGEEAGGDGSVFNMAVMGLRLAGRANGVSRLHGEVSRRMFGALWPGFEPAEVPIGHITNGVHGGTWIAPLADELYARQLGADYRVAGRSFAPVYDIADEELWSQRRQARQRLVADVRLRVGASWARRGVRPESLAWLERLFDPAALTIGFARRVPAYKRLTLILHEADRFRGLLLDQERPVQLVVAGKAHPADEGGKLLIQAFAEFASDPDVRHRIVFLDDYDMAMARTLVAGVDVWLNNPLRPLEACGTSGMKAALNGGLNLSILDGWWDELYDGANGWAIPSADDGTLAPERRDRLEAAAILDLLSSTIVPLFYDRPDGIPRRWLAMIKHNLASIGPNVLGSRMVRDYLRELYEPAGAASARLAADGFAAAAELARFKTHVRGAWPGVRVREVRTGGGALRAGGSLGVVAVVELGALAPGDVQVAAVFGRVDAAAAVAGGERLTLHVAGEEDGAVAFGGDLPVAAGSFGYTVRVLPRHELLTGPAELGLVCWAQEPARRTGVAAPA